MREVLGFFAAVVGGLFDPIALAGYIGAGICGRQLAVVFAIAGAWALAVIMIVSSIALFPIDWTPRMIFVKFAGAAIVSGVTFWIAARRRKSRAVADSQEELEQ